MSSPCRTHSTTCRDAEDPAAGSDGGKLHSSSTTPPAFPRTSDFIPWVLTAGFTRSRKMNYILISLLLHKLDVMIDIDNGVCISQRRLSKRTAECKISNKMTEILTKQANDCHHSESLQIWSCWPHICHSCNLQHVQSVGKRDTIVTITLLPWLHARRQPSVTDFQTKKAIAELPLLS